MDRSITDGQPPASCGSPGYVHLWETMNDIIERHWRPFLIALACVALVSACLDLALREWMQTAASGLLLLGVLAFWRSLHYHSVRWRAVSGIALVLAMTMQFIRFVSA